MHALPPERILDAADAPARPPAGRAPSALPTLAVLAVLAALGWLAADRLLVDRSPILVGLLHSQTGPLAVSERSMIDAEILAIEEINRAGGLLGRPVRWVVADGGSDGPTFAREAERLIRDRRVSVIVGCASSASRKSVLPVLESNDHVLVYPAASEGLEQSPHVVYAGAAPNQQITPAVQWCHEALSARRFLLVGSDSVWPRCVNAIAGDQIAGIGAEMVGEVYVPFGGTDVDEAVQRVVATGPDVVLCSLVGDAAVAFLGRLRAAGVQPERTPVVMLAIAEDELRTLPAADVAGHYAARCYFQSIDRPENLAFVRGFKARYGEERTTSDAIVSAYDGVRLWAQAVREAGTADIRQVRDLLRHQSLDAPEGIIAVDPETQHVWRPVFIGRVRPDRQFDIVWSSRTAVRPVPFPLSRPRSEWVRLVDDLRRSWGGRWSGAAAGWPAPGEAARP